jgi:hypothetical protein
VKEYVQSFDDDDESLVVVLLPKEREKLIDVVGDRDSDFI